MGIALIIQFAKGAKRVASELEVRCVVAAVLCKAMFDGKKLPVYVSIYIVPGLLVRGEEKRLAEIVSSPTADTHIIRISEHDRGRESVLYSVMHELVHLIRIINRENKPTEEEEMNVEAIIKSQTILFEYLASALYLYSDNPTMRFENEEALPDLQPGKTVRDRDIGDTVRPAI